MSVALDIDSFEAVVNTAFVAGNSLARNVFGGCESNSRSFSFCIFSGSSGPGCCWYDFIEHLIKDGDITESVALFEQLVDLGTRAGDIA